MGVTTASSARRSRARPPWHPRIRARRADRPVLATGLLHVRRGWDEYEGEIAPKSRNGRRKIPIAAVLRDYLDHHLLDHNGPRVFPSPWWVVKATGRAHDVWEAAGLPTITLHDCRHTFASFAIESSMNAKTLCTVMGHADIATTFDLYGHLLPGSQDEAAARLDAYFARTVVHPAEMAA